MIYFFEILGCESGKAAGFDPSFGGSNPSTPVITEVLNMVIKIQ